MSFIFKITLSCKFNISHTLTARLTEVTFQLNTAHQLAQSSPEINGGLLSTELHAMRLYQWSTNQLWVELHGARRSQNSATLYCSSRWAIQWGPFLKWQCYITTWHLSPFQSCVIQLSLFLSSSHTLGHNSECDMSHVRKKEI